MDAKWHIAFCNVTYVEYAGLTYRDYYGSPAVMLEAQLAARDYAERRFGVGRFISPHVDGANGELASFLGMRAVEPDGDELPYIDTAHPVVTSVAEADRIRIGDPRTTGLMAKRWETWQYYRSRGYDVGFGGYGGGIITEACEISGGAVLGWLAEDPVGATKVLDLVMEAELTIARFDHGLRGQEYAGLTYTGDDFSGLLSPAMYRRFAVPYYLRLYAGNETRFMHSELLRAEHLRIARDEVGITDFHGAGCAEVSLEEMRQIMGERFWAQLTPQEMAELSPAALRERVRVLADSGAGHVQLYPGRHVPERNMEAAISAAQAECPGGPLW